MAGRYDFPDTKRPIIARFEQRSLHCKLHAFSVGYKDSITTFHFRFSLLFALGATWNCTFFLAARKAKDKIISSLQCSSVAFGIDVTVSEGSISGIAQVMSSNGEALGIRINCIHIVLLTVIPPKLYLLQRLPSSQRP